MADSVDKRIQDLEVSIKQFQLGVKDIVANGEKAKTLLLNLQQRVSSIYPF
jgi:hypothetical protein